VGDIKILIHDIISHSPSHLKNKEKEKLFNQKINQKSIHTTNLKIRFRFLISFLHHIETITRGFDLQYPLLYLFHKMTS